MKTTELATLCKALASHGSTINAIKSLTVLLAVISEKLSKVEEVVTKIQEGPYKTGILHLENASTTTDMEARSELLKEACDNFITAAGRVEGRMLARTHFCAGCCYDLRGYGDIALAEYARAFDAALKYERDGKLTLANNDDGVRKVKIGSAAVGGVMGAAAGGYVAVAMAMTGSIAGMINEYRRREYSRRIVAIPAAPLITVVGAVVGAAAVFAVPGLTVSQLSRKVGQLFVGGLEKELDEFFDYFTRPLALLIIKRGCKSEIRELVESVSKGVRPNVS